jgi:hypothetical protein
VGKGRLTERRGEGLGECLDGVVEGHQLRLRVAFQMPQGRFEEVMAERARHGADHYIRIGDRPYSVTDGWPSVYAMHIGGGFLRPGRHGYLSFAPGGEVSCCTERPILRSIAGSAHRPCPSRMTVRRDAPHRHQPAARH